MVEEVTKVLVEVSGTCSNCGKVEGSDLDSFEPHRFLVRDVVEVCVEDWKYYVDLLST